MSNQLSLSSEAEALEYYFKRAVDCVNHALRTLNEAEGFMQTAACIPSSASETAPHFLKNHQWSPSVPSLLQSVIHDCIKDRRFDVQELMRTVTWQLGTRAWYGLFHTSHLRSVLDSETIDREIAEIERKNVPFTMEEILKLYASYATQLDEIRTRSILAVLRRLDSFPPSGRFPLQAELRMGYIFDKPDSRHFDCRALPLFNDVEMLIYALAQQQLPALQLRAERELREACSKGQSTCMLPFFTAHISENGSVSLTLSKPELIEEARRIWEEHSRQKP